MDAPLLLSQKIYFVLPDDRERPSGGNIYNKQLINALKNLGQAVEIIDFASYQEAVMRGQEGIYGVDSLFVDDMLPLIGVQYPKPFSFFIMHHLQSLHPPIGMKAAQFFEEHERGVLQYFQAFLLSSEYSKEYLRQKGITAPMMVVEPAGTSASSTSSIPLAYPIKALMVANVVDRKGILPFLEALSDQVEQDDAFVLDIIGRTDMEPDYFKTCKECVEASVLRNKVHFLGAMQHEDTLKAYALHHIFLSASKMETFGMAIQEAKAQGLPLLLCQGGYAQQHLTQGSGMLCANTFKLAGNFIELCRNDRLMQDLWQPAMVEKKVLEAYTWNQAAAHFLKLFRDFLL